MTDCDDVQLLISTNANTLIRIQPDGTTTFLYGGSGGNFDQLWTVPDAYENIFAYVRKTLSNDSGETWNSNSSADFDLNPSSPPTRSPTLGTPFVGFAMEEDGTIWSWTYVYDVPPHILDFSIDLYKSVDNGVTWTLEFHSPQSWFHFAEGWLSDNYLWRIFGTGTPINTLWQLDLSTLTESTYSLPISYTGAPTLTGWYGSSYLYAYQPFGSLNTPVSHNLLVIDISTPSSPVFTQVTNPFGATLFIQTVLPSPNGTAVALAVNSDLSQGSLWYSSNGGLTWANTVAQTTKLGPRPGGTGPIGHTEIKSSFANPDILWATGAFPFVYYSNDGGQNWAEIEVTANLGSSAYWTAMCLVCGDDVPPTTFQAQCGDIIVGATSRNVDGGALRTLTEFWRAGSLVFTMFINRIPGGAIGTNLAIDKDGAIYFPYMLSAGSETSFPVVKLEATLPNFTYGITGASFWWTPPTNNHVVSVSIDDNDYVYVLCVAGDPDFYSCDTINLYKLTSAAVLIASFTSLVVPAGHDVSGISSGGAISKNGETVYYHFGDDNEYVLVKYNLLSAESSILVIDNNFDTIYPQGIIVDELVVAGNEAAWFLSNIILTSYRLTGASRKNYLSVDSFYNGGGIAAGYESNKIVAADYTSGKVYKIDIRTNKDPEVLFTTLNTNSFLLPLAVLCPKPLRAAGAASFATLIGAT